jgi:uncharacterized protein YqeY
MLKEQISTEIKEAMKSGDSWRLGVLRMLSAAFMNAEIAMREKGEMTEADYQTVVKKEVKKRQDSIVAYTDAGRPELAEAEKKEADFLAVYLPEEMGEAEVKKIVDEVVAEKGIDNLGMLIGEVKARTEGKADGGMIAKLVKERIS